MKALLFCLSFVLFSICVTAQNKETVKSIYLLEGKTPSSYTIENQKSTTVLKILNPQRSKNLHFIVGDALKQSIDKGILTIYKDEACQNAFTKSELPNATSLIGLDTIPGIDPMTQEPVARVVRSEKVLFPTNASVYEFSQQFNYDAANNLLNSQINKVHLSYLRRNPSNEVMPLDTRIPLFSFKNTDKNIQNPAQELHQSNITWAKQIKYDISISDAGFRAQLLSNEHLKGKKIVSWYDNKTPISTEQLKLRTQPQSGIIDTIVTFDPETFAETYQIKKIVWFYDTKHITQFRIVQDIYFDAAVNTFTSRILAIAPLNRPYQNDVLSNNSFPLFWIVYNDDFLENE